MQNDELALNRFRTTPDQFWTGRPGPPPAGPWDPLEAPSTASMRFEPTVLAAVRRYRVAVLAAALLGMLVAVTWSLVEPRRYQARAEVTVPRQLSLPELETNQYLDSQVMLLQSQEVARNAVRLANSALGGERLTADDFFGERSRLQILPPAAASADGYGASIITVSFTGPSAHVAKVAADAVLVAFDDARTAAITAQGAVTIAGIDRAIAEATTPAQRANLLNERSRVVVNQQIDLSHHPITTWATEPATAVNGRWARNGGIGLLVGAVAGAALAFAWACRRRRLDDPLEPATVYGVPLMGEIPVTGVPPRARTAGLSGRSPRPRGPLPLVTAGADAAFAEAFRFAAGHLEQARAGCGGRLATVVVSPRAGAGRTTVAAGLALALAEGGTRVLAVDGDDGTLAAALLPGVAVTGGVGELLAGRGSLGECVADSPLAGSLTVLGPGTGDAPRVSGGARLRAACDLLVEARARFEVVVVDGPPLLEASDAVALAEAADAAVVVACPDDPLRDHLDLVDRLRSFGVRPFGYVYDRVPRIRSGASRLAVLTGPGAAVEG